MSIEFAETKDLIPLNQAIREEIPGEPSYSTVWRWIRRGLAPAIPSEPRIKLSVKYVGSKPFTSRTLIQDFIERATRARLARMARDEQQSIDVSDAELAAVGLTSPN
jgi:hypothetical protein